MLPYKKAVADFWAELASIPDWQTVTETQRRRLRAEYDRLCFALGNDAIHNTAASAARKQKQFAALTISYRRHAPQVPTSHDQDLAHLYSIAHKTIVPIVKGQSAPLPVKHGATRHVRLAEDGTLALAVTYTTGVDILMNELSALVQHDAPFPFSPCPGCGTVVVATGKQRWCSRLCITRTWHKSNRPARREYMRDYMAERRKQAKQATAA